MNRRSILKSAAALFPLAAASSYAQAGSAPWAGTRKGSIADQPARI